MDHERFRRNVRELYKIVSDLEDMFPGRFFTPDGHMVGSLGECLVADAYELELMQSSNEGYDAIDRNGKKIEIKATQGERVAFRSCPEYTIVIKIFKDGTFKECFNGPGELIWNQFKGRSLPTNGQFQISINRLMKLNQMVLSLDRIDK